MQTEKPHPTLPLERFPSPSYVVETGRLQQNLHILKRVQDQSGARIILALKGFAMHALFAQIAEVLKGTTASSLNEARLGAETFGGEVHVYAVAYAPQTFPEIARLAHHITFNSWNQWRTFAPLIKTMPSPPQCGLRINPEYSEVKTSLYNPCRPGTRFGIRASELQDKALQGISGFHFHTMCEQGADTLARTLDIVEQKFAPWLHQLEWMNLGGGHHITRPGYDLDLLCNCIEHLRKTYDVQVYLEPGEAVALHTGYLISTILDRIDASPYPILILDTSATAHMPDVLEMPYRPHIIGSDLPQKKPHTYTLGGLTCLAGDEIGSYSFDHPLEVGDRLVFTDMAHYTMVKNTTFNGIDLPAICSFDEKKNQIMVHRRFTYEDYKGRLS